MPVKVLYLRFKGADRKFAVAVDAYDVTVIDRHFLTSPCKLYSFQCSGEDRSSGSVNIKPILREVNECYGIVALYEE